MQSTELMESLRAAPRPMTIVSDSVAKRCQSILRESSHQSLRRLTCVFHEGALSIRGMVPSFFLKQLAQATIGKLGIVAEIDNQVLVHAEPRQGRAGRIDRR